jgi:hypothetical protein
MLHVVPPSFRTLVEVNPGTLNANTYNSRLWKDSMFVPPSFGGGWNSKLLQLLSQIMRDYGL